MCFLHDTSTDMRWQRFVGSINSLVSFVKEPYKNRVLFQISFVKEPYKNRVLFQKRADNLGSLLIFATP